MNYRCFFNALLLLVLSAPILSVQAGTITGDLSKWAPINIDFVGPSSSETSTAPNPFLDYRLNVTMTAPDGRVLQVPGFFAGDGNGGASGDRWRVRFAADQVGQWRYQASLKSGPEIAISTDLSAGTTVSVEGATGEFSISQQSTDAPGFLAHGRLEYTGEHYLKFRDGPYWIKSGTDSPENFLGYAGIDGTVDAGGSQFLHDFATHRSDARGDDPVFSNASSGADSLGITGALNYLSDQGVNSIYFLPMNLGGDGQETYPYVGSGKSRYNKTHFDISKLFQWNQVLSHAQRRGIALNIQLSETEVENERWLDDGKMGLERKLFFRELIARFGYLLAAKWNLGEENDFPVSQLREQASYLNKLDWTKKPIAVHTQINNFRDYEKLVGDELFSASSIQYDPPLADEFVETWRKRSADAGRRWVIDMDENTGGISDRNADTRRKQIMYDVYFSGGNLEWYYGYHPLPLGGDLTAGDFRQREAIWTTMRYARTFMETQLPFWRMQPADQLVTGEADSFGGAEVFAAPGEIYAIYLPAASGNPTLDLSAASGSFSQQWFNPRNGQFAGDAKSIVSGQRVALGSPPSSRNDDWVVLVKSHNAPDLPDFTVAQPTPNQTSADSTADSPNVQPADEVPVAEPTTDEPVEQTDAQTTDSDQLEDQASDQSESTTTPATPEPTDADPVDAQRENTPPEFLDPGELPLAEPGQLYSLTVTATDAEGVAPVVSAEALPSGMQFTQVADGVASLDWQVPPDLTDAVSFRLIATDVQDKSITTTLDITIVVNVVSSENSEPENDTTNPVQNNEPAINTLADMPDSTRTDDTAQSTDGMAELDNAVDNMTDSMTSMLAMATDLPPIIVGVEDNQLMVGQTIRRTVVPVDPEGIVAALRLDSELNGIKFADNGKGGRELVWTAQATDIGMHELRFVATDLGSTPHVVQQIMNLEVIANGNDVDVAFADNTSDTNFAPLFVPIEDQEIQAGDTISFKVRPIDPNGSVPILHVVSPPEGAQFIDSGLGYRTFSWTAPDGFSGEILLQFVATDNDDIEVTVEQEVRVNVLP